MSAPLCEDIMQPNERGFTLIELMIVVAIVAILASIAYPSYVSYIARSSRAEVKSALLEDVQFLERNFTVSNKYDEDSAGNAIATIDLPAQQTPTEGQAKYVITLSAVGTTTFTLTATPAGSMATDGCGAFTINQAGTKRVVGASLSNADCWGR